MDITIHLYALGTVIGIFGFGIIFGVFLMNYLNDNF